MWVLEKTMENPEWPGWQARLGLEPGTLLVLRAEPIFMKIKNYRFWWSEIYGQSEVDSIKKLEPFRFTKIQIHNNNPAQNSNTKNEIFTKFKFTKIAVTQIFVSLKQLLYKSSSWLTFIFSIISIIVYCVHLIQWNRNII